MPCSGVTPGLDPHTVATTLQAAEDLVREILEALCARNGLSLESSADPGTPARNYELADRLGIGYVFGLQEKNNG